MFHALHKVDMRACYTKQRINLACTNKGFGGAMIMDLSKAFDTFTHNLLIAKLHAYGFSNVSLKLLYSYLSNRWHRTNIS